MNLLVLGGSGPTGQKLIEQALEQRHRVTALVRDPTTLPSREGVTVVQGSPMNAEDVERVAPGQEAILSVLGSRSPRKTELYSRSGRNVIAAMRKHGVRRFIVTTSGGVEQDDPSFDFFYKHVLKPLLLERSYADCRRLEQTLRESRDLEWIAVRPTMLTDGPRTGTYRVSPRYAPPQPKGRTAQVSRADLADFILRQLGDSTYLHGTPTVAY